MLSTNQHLESIVIFAITFAFLLLWAHTTGGLCNDGDC